MSDREPRFRKYERAGRNGAHAEMVIGCGIPVTGWVNLLLAEKQGRQYEPDMEVPL